MFLIEVNVCSKEATACGCQPSATLLAPQIASCLRSASLPLLVPSHSNLQPYRRATRITVLCHLHGYRYPYGSYRAAYSSRLMTSVRNSLSAVNHRHFLAFTHTVTPFTVVSCSHKRRMARATNHDCPYPAGTLTVMSWPFPVLSRQRPGRGGCPRRSRGSRTPIRSPTRHLRLAPVR